MKLLPQSLNGRLLTSGVALVTVSMVVAAILIGAVLERFIVGQIDQRLDNTINDLISQLSRNDDGSLELAARGESPDFMHPKSGWYWQIKSSHETLRSPTLQTDLQVESPHFDWLQFLSGGAAPTRIVETDGQTLHGRVKTITLDSKAVTIAATAPRMAIMGPLFQSLSALLICLAALSLLMVLGLWLQVKIGLRPLSRLRANVAQIANGEIESLPTKQPTELEPLVAELNNLIRQNAERLELTRLQAANLAHSLKTPLASLSLALADQAFRPELRKLVERMEQGIKHHLGRTRLAVSGDHRHKPLVVRNKIAEILHALERIYADRNIALALQCPEEVSVTCDASDFNEIVGNLLENAFKWAATRVDVDVQETDRYVEIRFTDDGPGLTEEQRHQVLQPGKRLDETVPGDGFGLPIVAELLTLYGGTLQLLPNAKRRGLVAVVFLPRRWR